MQQPNLININGKIINLDNVNSVEKFSEHEDGTGRFKLVIKFETYNISFLGNDAEGAYEFINGMSYVYSRNPHNDGGVTGDFINPNWTQQRVTSIEHKTSNSG